LLAGLAGAIRGNLAYNGFAHLFYNQSTKIAITNRRLHGEVVGYGLAVQWAIEQKPVDKIADYLSNCHLLGLPISLKDLGIVSDSSGSAEDKVHSIAHLMQEFATLYAPAAANQNSQTYYQAINQVDSLGQQLV
jgi:glycerol dehydrogenase-like iron-containing ADH family enzyme